MVMVLQGMKKGEVNSPNWWPIDIWAAQLVVAVLNEGTKGGGNEVENWMVGIDIHAVNVINAGLIDCHLWYHSQFQCDTSVP